MKDSVAKGITNTKQAGQLRKDAAVQGRKSSIGKRNSGSGLSSSSSLISGSSSTTHSSSSISGINSRNASRRMQNEQNINKAIKTAEKIPVARKYAKMAKMVERIKSTRNKGFFQNLMAKVGEKSNASAADVEEANRAEQTGEEYKPDAAEARYTAITTRQMKYLVIFVLGGIIVAAIFFCVILVSSLADSGGKAYLASKSSPTEDELNEWYGNSDDNSSSSVDSRVKQGSTGNIIMVGDSRTVGLCNSVYGISVSNCSTLGFKKDNNTFISLTSTAYDWFSSKALPEIKKQLNSNEESTVFINMGTNRLDDLTNQANSYAKDYNDLAKTYPKANIVAISVTPIIDSKVSYYKNVNLDSNVVKFNNQLKSKISSDVIYCDVYSKVKGKVDASDGVHYDTASYKLINDEILNCIKPSSSVSKTGKAAVDKMNQIALNEAASAVSRKKYQDWFGVESDWCGMFVSWLFDQVGGLDKYYVKDGYAGSGARRSIAAGYGKWYEDECTDSNTVPKPGDVMHSSPCVPGDGCYVDRYSSGHVGYVYKVDDDYIYTVEGNHDPEKVVTVKHKRKDCNINGYYRPNY